MPRYQLKDPQTGKTITINASKKPTQADAQEVFNRVRQQAPIPKQPEENRLLNAGSGLANLAGFGQSVGTVALASLLPGLRKQTEATQNLQEAQQQAQTLLLNRANQTSDQVEKNRLINQSKGITTEMQQGRTDLGGEVSQVMKAGNLTEADLQRPTWELAARRGLGSGTEVGAALLPGTTEMKNLQTGLQATRKGRILGAGLQGGAQSTLQGISRAAKDSESVGDAALTAGGTGLSGFLFGAGMQGAFEAPGAIKAYLKNKSPEGIRKIIRPNPSKIDQFQKNTGLNFEDEILKRDGDDIAGMNYDELVDFFGNKRQQTYGAADDFLASQNKTIKKSFVTEALEKQKSLLDKKRGNINVDSAVNQIDNVIADLDLAPDDLDLVTVNRIKRQAQDLADSALGDTGSPTNTSRAFAVIQRELNDKLESIAPGVKDINKTTQLYRLADISTRRTATREANKITTSAIDKLLQQLPAAAGIGGFAVGGPVGAGIGFGLTGGSSIAREKLRSPQVQTTLANRFSKLTADQMTPENFDKLLVLQRILNQGTGQVVDEFED